MGVVHQTVGYETGCQELTPRARVDALAVDVVFRVSGDRIAADYRPMLWSALVVSLPWLAGTSGAGIVELRATPTGGQEALLPRRARLVLRVPLFRASECRSLASTTLQIGTYCLRLGAATDVPLKPWPTLYAPSVSYAISDELQFIASLRHELQERGVRCGIVLGRRVTWGAGEQCISGYPVALTEVARDAALAIQSNGVGLHRGVGCGVFRSHKKIEALDE